MKFDLEFIVTLVVTLYAVYLVNAGTPNTNPFITFLLLPLLIAYLVVMIINNLFPTLADWGNSVGNYVEAKAVGNLNSTGYIQLFPPVLAVMIVFVLLLYNRKLG